MVCAGIRFVLDRTSKLLWMFHAQINCNKWNINESPIQITRSFITKRFARSVFISRYDKYDATKYKLPQFPSRRIGNRSRINKQSEPSSAKWLRTARVPIVLPSGLIVSSNRIKVRDNRLARHGRIYRGRFWQRSSYLPPLIAARSRTT